MLQAHHFITLPQGYPLQTRKLNLLQNAWHRCRAFQLADDCNCQLTLPCRHAWSFQSTVHHVQAGLDIMIDEVAGAHAGRTNGASYDFTFHRRRRPSCPRLSR